MLQLLVYSVWSCSSLISGTRISLTVRGGADLGLGFDGVSRGTAGAAGTRECGSMRRTRRASAVGRPGSPGPADGVRKHHSVCRHGLKRSPTYPHSVATYEVFTYACPWQLCKAHSHTMQVRVLHAAICRCEPLRALFPNPGPWLQSLPGPDAHGDNPTPTLSTTAGQM